MKLLIVCKDLNNEIISENLNYYSKLDWVDEIHLIYKEGSISNFNAPIFKFIHESEVQDWLNINLVKKHLPFGFKSRSGWYFQQLIKMVYLYQQSEDFLLVDGDCRILSSDLNQIRKIGVMSHAYRPWSITTEELIGSTTNHLSFSFVTENMYVPAGTIARLFGIITADNDAPMSKDKAAVLEILCTIKRTIRKCLLRNIIHMRIVPMESYDALSEYELIGRILWQESQVPSVHTRHMIRLSLSRNWLYYQRSNEDLHQIGIEP